MCDRYMSKPEIAALFNTSAKAAEEQLARTGLRPINLGPGRKLGKRWLASAVMESIQRIHEKAQPRAKMQHPAKPANKPLGLAEMSAKDVARLVEGGKPAFTSQHIIQ